MLMLKTDVPVSPEKRERILKAVSSLLAETTGKPEAYVMVTFEAIAGLMAGKPGPVAFADVRGIGGLTKAVNGKICAKLSDLLESELSVPAARLYVTFTDVPASSWGWNRGTFG